ncbi:MAG: C-terminal binding protein [Bacteroidota bacterium]
MKPIVVITDWGFQTLDPEREVFGPLDVELREYQCKTEEEVVEAVKEADVVLAQWAPVKSRAIESMRRCRGIVRYGIGLDNIDLQKAKERGIPVRNVPDYCLDEVADHTMALMLALQRQVSRVDALVRGGTWKITPPLALPPMRQSVLGLVGFGRISRIVANRAWAFGMRVVSADPFVWAEEFASEGVTGVGLEDLFAQSDIISLHCPLTDETRHTIREETLGMMKPNALLVNTSRGGLVDTGALIAALRDGRLAGAGLDVVEGEPLSPESPLLSLPNLLITSHVAWYSSASVGELQRRAALAAAELLRS